MKERYYIIDRW